MEFTGSELLLIVANQGSPINALDGFGGLERRFDNPHDALKLIAAGGYVGIGHRKRIRYIRPEDPEHHRIPWASIGEVSTQMAHDRRHRAPEVFGLKKWVEHEPAHLPRK